MYVEVTPSVQATFHATTLQQQGKPWLWPFQIESSALPQPGTLPSCPLPPLPRWAGWWRAPCWSLSLSRPTSAAAGIDLPWGGPRSLCRSHLCSLTRPLMWTPWVDRDTWDVSDRVTSDMAGWCDRVTEKECHGHQWQWLLRRINNLMTQWQNYTCWALRNCWSGHVDLTFYVNCFTSDDKKVHITWQKQLFTKHSDNCDVLWQEWQ